MTTTPPVPPALLQRAQLQTQANRYGLLRKAADNKLVQKIANS